MFYDIDYASGNADITETTDSIAANLEKSFKPQYFINFTQPLHFQKQLIANDQ